MKTFNFIFTLLFLFVSFASADVTGTKIQGPALIEGFNEVVSSAGTTTLTKDSQTKQILTGSTTHTYVLPDATTLPLSRRFFIINKSTGTATIQTSGGGALTIVSSGLQKEFHLRAAGSAAGTWDVLEGGGSGGAWGGITGTLSDQTDLQTALNAKAPSASPTFTGTIGTPLTASRALVTDASGNLSASSVTSTQVGYLGSLSGDLQTSLDLKAPLASPTFTGTIGTPLTASKLLATDASGNLTATAANSSQASYLDLTSSAQTQLDAKQLRSTLTTKGDLYVATASATTARQGVGTNGQTLIADSAATNGIRYKTPLVDNFIKNGDAESTSPIVTYADAAGTRPVDGTGGSPGVTTSISSTAPLADTNSFLLTKDAVNRQGNGWSIPFTIPSSMKAKVAQIELDYIVNSGTFAAGSSSSDGDLIVYIYDVTNSTLIEPSSIKFLSSSTATSDRIVTNFQTSATGTSYNLILHVASTSASAWELKTDNIQVKPSQYVYGTPISDWVSYTPTVSNLGTGSTSSNVAKWRRVGDSAEYMITFQKDGSGGSGASVVTWDLASGQSIDATKLPFGSSTAKADNIGSAWVVSGGNYSANNYFPLANSATTFAINKPTASGQLTGADIPASTYIIFRATVPITGWSSSTQVSDGYDGRRVDLQLSTNAGSIATSATTWTTITFSTPEIDDVSCWNGTDTCTIKSAGDYEIGLMAGQNSAAANYFRIGYQKNSDSEVVLGQGIGKTGGSALPFGSKVLRLAAGDTIKFKAFTEGTEGISATRSAYIKKVLAPTTMSATEVVSFRGYIASNQALTADTTNLPLTVIKDSHGVWTGSTYPAPYAGDYMVCASIINSATSGTYHVYVNGSRQNGYALFTADTTTFKSGCTSVTNVLSGQTISIRSNASVTALGDAGTSVTIYRIK